MAYRFEVDAHCEIDVTADNLEEAEEKAEKEWNDMFAKLGLFGSVRFMEEVQE